jgi:hypothetical protein
MDEKYMEVMKQSFLQELEKIGSGLSPEEQELAAAYGKHRDSLTGAQKLRHGLSMFGGGTAGAGLGAGLGYLGSKGVNALARRQVLDPATMAGVAGSTGGVLGLLGGGIVGDIHGQSDVNAGKSLENYAKKEDKVYGPGMGRVVMQ